MAILGGKVGAPFSTGKPCKVVQGSSKAKCDSSPGYGGPLRWRVEVGGQLSAWTFAQTPFKATGPFASTYARPVVSSIEPASGPTRGGSLLVLTGTNFALTSTVRIGDNPGYLCTVLRSNTTHIEAVLGEGVGASHRVVVTIGTLSNVARGDASDVRFSYDLPTVTTIRVLRGFGEDDGRGGVGGGNRGGGAVAGGAIGALQAAGVVYTAVGNATGNTSATGGGAHASVAGGGSSGGAQGAAGGTAGSGGGGNTNNNNRNDEQGEQGLLHGPTRGGVILEVEGTNFGPKSCALDRNSSYACGCSVRLGPEVTCKDGKSATMYDGGWCQAISWDHESIMCKVTMGVGAGLRVGLVAGGVYHVEEYLQVSTGRTLPRFVFSYDAPVVSQVTPSFVAVEGGDNVVIQGSNFGAPGTTVVVQPDDVLDCSNSSLVVDTHSTINCKSRAGRGVGHKVVVTVEQQVSTAKSGEKFVNISYLKPRITSVVPGMAEAGPKTQKLEIKGDHFGTTTIEDILIVISDSKNVENSPWKCEDATWLPARKTGETKSYLTCTLPGDIPSGAKNVSLRIGNDANAYPLEVFQGMFGITCQKDWYRQPITGDCAECPTGATCAGGDADPIAMEGNMRLPVAANGTANNIKFVRCTPKSACSGGGKCAVGYETPENFCVGCQKRSYGVNASRGYYKLSGECKECPELAGLFLALYASALLVFGVLGVAVIKKGPSVAVLGVGIDYYQVLSIFIAFDIRWPSEVREVLNVVSISNLNIELVSPQVWWE